MDLLDSAVRVSRYAFGQLHPLLDPSATRNFVAVLWQFYFENSFETSCRLIHKQCVSYYKTSTKSLLGPVLEMPVSCFTRRGSQVQVLYRPLRVYTLPGLAFG